MYLAARRVASQHPPTDITAPLYLNKQEPTHLFASKERGMGAPVHQKLGQSIPVLDVHHTLGRCEVARLHGFLQSLLDGLTRPHVELGEGRGGGEGGGEEGREEGRGDGGRGRGGGSLITCTLHTNYCTCTCINFCTCTGTCTYCTCTMSPQHIQYGSYFRGLCDSRWSFVLPATRL